MHQFESAVTQILQLQDFSETFGCSCVEHNDQNVMFDSDKHKNNDCCIFTDTSSHKSLTDHCHQCYFCKYHTNDIIQFRNHITSDHFENNRCCYDQNINNPSIITEQTKPSNCVKECNNYKSLCSKQSVVKHLLNHSKYDYKINSKLQTCPNQYNQIQLDEQYNILKCNTCINDNNVYKSIDQDKRIPNYGILRDNIPNSTTNNNLNITQENDTYLEESNITDGSTYLQSQLSTRVHDTEQRVYFERSLVKANFTRPRNKTNVRTKLRKAHDRNIHSNKSGILPTKHNQKNVFAMTYKRYACSICRVHYSACHSLARLHWALKHLRFPTKFGCGKCNKSFSNANLVIRHWQANHEQGQDLGCISNLICGFVNVGTGMTKLENLNLTIR